jgi:hypothetical protein
MDIMHGDMPKSSNSSEMCAGLDKAIDMLNSYIANPQMVNEKTLTKVVDLLSQHRNEVMGDSEAGNGENNSEASDMPMKHPMLDTPYRSDNMKRPNPYAR